MIASIIQTTCSTQEEAQRIATILVKEKLAACVQITECTSIYSWNDEICNDTEKLLSIKTKKENFEKVQRKIKENHSYDLPEIIEIKIENASNEYLKFIEGNTK